MPNLKTSLANFIKTAKLILLGVTFSTFLHQSFEEHTHSYKYIYAFIHIYVYIHTYMSGQLVITISYEIL